LVRGLRQVAGDIVATLGQVEPQRYIGSFRIEIVRLFEISLRLGEGSAIKIESASVKIGG
jgi:hypothetical protein